MKEISLLTLFMIFISKFIKSQNDFDNNWSVDFSQVNIFY